MRRTVMYYHRYVRAYWRCVRRFVETGNNQYRIRGERLFRYAISGKLGTEDVGRYYEFISRLPH